MNLPDSNKDRIENIVSRYREYLHSRNYSTPTVKNYLSDFRHFSNWIERKFNGFDFAKITDRSIFQYRADVKEIFKGKPTIAARRLSSLKIFVGWAVSQSLLPKELLKTLEPQKRNKDDLAVIGKFRTYLVTSDFSKPTIKNYLSDLRYLIHWVAGNYEQFKFSALREDSIRNYRSHLKDKFRTKPSISARRLSSLRKFLTWAGKNDLVPEELVRSLQKALVETAPKPVAPVVPPAPIQIVRPTLTQPPTPLVDISTYKLHQKAIHHIKNTRPSWYHNYHKKDWSSTLHTTLMVLFAVAVGSLFLYSEVIRPGLDFTRDQLSEELGDVLAAASPPSLLSFQGRLTNSSDVPVSSSTDIIFKIYDAETGGTLLWTSKTWSLTPDQNGIFSVCLGNQTTTDECLAEDGESEPYSADTPFPATLFSDNPALYLGVTAGADAEMTPRQRISSVSYALNSGTLDGFESSQTPVANEVPVLDGSGNLVFGGTATIDTSSGSLTLGSAGTGTISLPASGNDIAITGNLDISGNLIASQGTSKLAVGTAAVSADAFARITGDDILLRTSETKIGGIDLDVTFENDETNTGLPGEEGGTGTALNITANVDAAAGCAIWTVCSVDNLYAVNAKIDVTDIGGWPHVTNASVFRATGDSGSVAGFTNFKFFQAANPTGSIYSDVQGLAIEDIGSINASYVYGINIAEQTNGSNTYGIYQAGVDDDNVFAGNVRIGSTSNPGVTLDVTGDFQLTGNITDSNSAVTINDTLVVNDITKIGNASGNDYLEFAEEAGDPTCGAGLYAIWANSTDGKLKKCENGTPSDLDTTGGGGGGGAASDFISVTTDENSNGSTAEYDIFEDGNYTGTLDYTTNANDSITFTPADGRYTVSTAGTYIISVNFVMATSGFSALTDLTIKINGLNVYDKGVLIHGSVDPVERSVTIIKTLSASDYIEVFVDNSAAETITMQNGTSISISPIGGGGGGGGSSYDDYISVTATANSTSSFAEYDVFESGNYSAYTSTTHAFKNITYASATGRFTVTNAGTYLISFDSITKTSSFNITTLSVIKLNGGVTPLYSETTGNSYNNYYGDPEEKTISIVYNLSANDYLEFLIDGSANVASQSGTTATITKIGSGADLAEIYQTNDPSIRAGEVVSIDPSLLKGVRKNAKPYDSSILGIVSTNPGKVIGADADLTKNLVILGLTGRAPVKVSTENGAIQPGDLLTSSSTPGVAMKSTKPGYVIGRALSSYDSADPDEVGTVLVFINTHYSNPAQLDENGNVSSFYDWERDNKENIAALERLRVDEYNNIVASISDGSKFVWENSVGDAVAWINDTGEAVFNKVTALAGDFGKLVFGELEVKADSQAAGEEKIKSGGSEIFVTSEKVTTDSLIYVTSTTRTNGLNLFIKEKKPDEGFTVGIERTRETLEDEATPSAAKAIKFNWLIINRQ